MNNLLPEYRVAQRINQQFKYVAPLSLLVKSGANGWSDRMQMGGQVSAITHLADFCLSRLTEIHNPKPPITFIGR